MSDPKTAVVTGASRGIGATIAERLAQDGFAVVINYAGSTAPAEALAAKIGQGGGGPSPCRPTSAIPPPSAACSMRRRRRSAASTCW